MDVCLRARWRMIKPNRRSTDGKKCAGSEGIGAGEEGDNERRD